jgi:hypothetical protein
MAWLNVQHFSGGLYQTLGDNLLPSFALGLRQSLC